MPGTRHTTARTMTPVRTDTGMTMDRAQQVRREVWSAVSLGANGEPDGLWIYEREDSPSTPWTVTYGPWRADGADPHGEYMIFFGSLAAARRATFAGTVLPQLEEMRRERVAWRAELAAKR